MLAGQSSQCDASESAYLPLVRVSGFCGDLQLELEADQLFFSPTLSQKLKFLSALKSLSAINFIQQLI